MPVYGKGENVRDWLYVDDHAEAIVMVFEEGRPGETYNIGGHNEKHQHRGRADASARSSTRWCRMPNGPRERLITYVTDRPGHDRRYAIDASQNPARTRLDAPRDLRDGHAQDGRSGTSTIPSGRPTCRAVPTASNASAG